MDYLVFVEAGLIVGFTATEFKLWKQYLEHRGSGR
jgi:hypothetical protein